jgi:hypothetical protein
MFNYNLVPNTNRETRRKVEKYRRKHPKLTFIETYNQLFGTNYSEPPIGISTADLSGNKIKEVSTYERN